MNRSFLITFFLQSDDLWMSSRLDVDSIYRNQISVLLVFWFYRYFAGKRESSTWLEDIRGLTDSHWFRRSLSHINIKADFLKGEIFGLLYKQLPDILFLGFGKDRLFCLKLSRIIPDFDVYDTFHHGLNLFEVIFSSSEILLTKLLDQLFM